jgi:hypothetical protein
VITGFNTDIEHDGVIYHVQTEDKGLDTPIILSLVYVGGAILASKRAPYEDLIAEGFSDEVLAERLKRQHRLICAAINSGRINDLKKMSMRPLEVEGTGPLPAPRQELELETVREAEPPDEAETVSTESSGEFELEEVVEETAPALPVPEFEFEIEEVRPQLWMPPEKVEPPTPVSEVVTSSDEQAYDQDHTIQDSHGESHFADTLVEQGLTILLLDDAEFTSGESRTLNVLVVDRHGTQEKPLGNVSVSVKILGTTFRPLIYTLKTDRDGVASVATQIPQFTSGRAAVLVRAVGKDQAAELRRVIHPTR